MCPTPWARTPGSSSLAAAFLVWSISYSLQLRREALSRRKGREDLVKRKDELIDKIADVEAQKESGRLDDKRYKQELKDLKFQLSKVLERIGSKPGRE